MRHELRGDPHNCVVRIGVVVNMQSLDISELARMLSNDFKNRPCVRDMREFEHPCLLEKVDESSQVCTVALRTIDDERQFKSNHIFNIGTRKQLELCLAEVQFTELHRIRGKTLNLVQVLVNIRQ